MGGRRPRPTGRSRRAVRFGRKCLLIWAFHATFALGQSPAPGGAEGSPVSVSVRVDGGTDPERIPEPVAWLHLFGVLARDPSLDEALDRRRRLAYLAHFFNRGCRLHGEEDLSLSETEMGRLLSVADTVVAGLRRAAADSDRERIVVQAAASLDGSVGVAAAAKIRRHVHQHVRRRIRILDFSMPAPGANHEGAKR